MYSHSPLPRIATATDDEAKTNRAHHSTNSVAMANPDSINLAHWLFDKNREAQRQNERSVDSEKHDLTESDCEEAVQHQQAAQVLRRDGRLLPKSVHVLLESAGRRTKYDPSVGGRSGFDRVMRRFGHLLEYVPIRDLNWTHNSVNPSYRNGHHGGNDIWSFYRHHAIKYFHASYYV